MKAFIDTILDDPFNNDPLLVLADWLMERGDPRGDRLAELPKLVETIKTMPIIYANVDVESIKPKRLYAYLRGRYTPFDYKERFCDYQKDLEVQRCSITSLLLSLKLINPKKAIEHIHNVNMKKYSLGSEYRTAAWAALDSTYPDLQIAAKVTFGKMYYTYWWQKSLLKWILDHEADLVGYV